MEFLELTMGNVKMAVYSSISEVLKMPGSMSNSLLSFRE